MSPQNNPLLSEFAADPEMSDLIAQFVEELPVRAAAVDQAWRAGRASDLKRIAHQLKGAGAGYGFPTIGEFAGRLEAQLAEGGDEAIRGCSRLVQDLLAECSRARAK